jgi:prepilin-type N-terminal cleavage/methylation domain-containing protein
MLKNEQGFSLVELLIVITILGIAASVAIPDISTTNVSRLELAATEIAGAMRFARSESMAQDGPRAFNQQSNIQRIRVFTPDISTFPWSPVYDVYHPLSKQLYDIDIKNHSFATADSISHNTIYRGTCNAPEMVYFDKDGTPWCTDPETVLLDQFVVILTAGAHTRTVTLHGITGRVTVQ